MPVARRLATSIVFRKSHHQFIALLRRTVCLTLSASLLVTSGEAAHAGALISNPSLVLPVSRLAFLRNENLMRLETQALSEAAASSAHVMLEDRSTFPFWSRLWVHWNSWRERPVHSKFPELTLAGLRRRWPSQTMISSLGFILSIVFVIGRFHEDLTQASLIVFPCFLALQILDFGSRVLLGIPLQFDLATVCCGLAGADRSVEDASPISFVDPMHPVMSGGELTQETEVTAQRGRHQAGAAIRLQYRDKEGVRRYKIIVVKVSNEKRSNLVELLEQEIRNALRIESLRPMGIEYPERVLEIRHTRLSTGSDPTIPEEAHPYLGEASHRDTTLYRKINGAWRLIKDTVQIAFVHNGDFDYFTWFNGDVIQQQDLKKELIADLVDPKHPRADHPNAWLDADSPVAAMMLTLLRTQYDAYAALRLGRKMLLSGKDRKRPVSPDTLNRWKTVFEAVISAWLEQGGDLEKLSRDPQGMGAADALLLFERLQEAFQTAQRADGSFIEDMNADNTRLMLHESLDAFLHNNLFRATQILSQRAMTSFGVGAISTVDENPVFFAKTQGLSLARNKTKKWRAWGSESMALTLAEPDAVQSNGDEDLPRVYEDRLDLDFVNGQVAELFEDGHADIFDVKQNRILTLDETEKLWFNMKDSQWTSVLKRDNSDRPAQADNNELAAHLREIDRMWTNPDGSFNKKSVNCIVAQNLADQIIELARKEKEGSLGVKTHFLSLGFHTDGTHARNLVEFLKLLFAGMNSLVIDPNEFLVDPARLLEETRMADSEKGETIGFPVDFYGAAFPTSQAAVPRLTRELSYIFGLTGGVYGNRDTNLARLLGQSMPAGSDYAANVLTSGVSWPRTQAQSTPAVTMHASINYLLIYLIRAVRKAQKTTPDAFSENPLGLKYTDYEAQRMLAMQRKEIDEVALLTGVDAYGNAIDSKVHRDLEDISKKVLSQEGNESRRQRWLYRAVILIPTIFVSIHFGGKPFSWLMYILPHSSLIPAEASAHFTAFITQHCGSAASMILWIVHFSTISVLDDAIIAIVAGLYYIGMSVVVVGVMRMIERRQVHARQGKRFIGIVADRIWYLAEDYWRNIFGVSQADATFQIGGGDPVGRIENHFLKRWKGELNRGSIVINVRGDDRIPLFNDSAGNMTSNLATVNRNIGWRPFFDFLNDRLFKFVFWLLRIARMYRGRPYRISYAGARVLALGRHWRENGNESWRIQMPTCYFPLPRPQEEFLDRMEKELGMTFDGEARARFFAAMNDLEKSHLEKKEMYMRGYTLGKVLGIPSPDGAAYEHHLPRFAKAFQQEDGKLFSWSAEDQASFERVQRWTLERMHPMSSMTALFVLGEDTGHRVNQPTNLRHRAVEVGTQEGAWFDTTATTVSANRALDEEVMKRPAKLVSLHVRVPNKPEATVRQTTAVASGGSADSASGHELVVELPYLFKTSKDMQFSMRLTGFRAPEPGEPFVLHFSNQLTPFRDGAGIEIVLGSNGTETTLSRLPLERFPANQANHVSIPSSLLDELGPLEWVGVRIVNAAGTFRVDSGQALHSGLWVQRKVILSDVTPAATLPPPPPQMASRPPPLPPSEAAAPPPSTAPQAVSLVSKPKKLTRKQRLEQGRNGNQPASTVPSPDDSAFPNRLSPDELDRLLGELPPDVSEPKLPNTTLLLKQAASESDLKWGPLVVAPDGRWNTQDTRISKAEKAILDALFNSPIWKAPSGKPVVVVVDQVPGRAAISEHFPDANKLGGRITLDSDLMEDLRRGIPFALMTARLELVEEMAELTQPPTAKLDDRFNLEVRMLWEKMKIYLKFDPSAQQGVVMYLRQHRSYDPDDVGLASLYERAAQVLIEVHVGKYGQQTVGDVLALDLRAYVTRAFAFETPTAEKRRWRSWIAQSFDWVSSFLQDLRGMIWNIGFESIRRFRWPRRIAAWIGPAAGVSLLIIVAIWSWSFTGKIVSAPEIPRVVAEAPTTVEPNSVTNFGPRFSAAKKPMVGKSKQSDSSPKAEESYSPAPALTSTKKPAISRIKSQPISPTLEPKEMSAYNLQKAKQELNALFVEDARDRLSALHTPAGRASVQDAIGQYQKTVEELLSFKDYLYRLPATGATPSVDALLRLENLLAMAKNLSAARQALTGEFGGDASLLPDPAAITDALTTVRELMSQPPRAGIRLNRPGVMALLVGLAAKLSAAAPVAVAHAVVSKALNDAVSTVVFPPDHVIRAGENLTLIARHHGVGVPDLLRLNPWIQNPNLIHPLEILRLPGQTVTLHLSAPASAVPSLPGVPGTLLDSMMDVMNAAVHSVAPGMFWAIAVAVGVAVFWGVYAAVRRRRAGSPSNRLWRPVFALLFVVMTLIPAGSSPAEAGVFSPVLSGFSHVRNWSGKAVQRVRKHFQMPKPAPPESRPAEPVSAERIPERPIAAPEPEPVLPYVAETSRPVETVEQRNERETAQVLFERITGIEPDQTNDAAYEELLGFFRAQQVPPNQWQDLASLEERARIIESRSGPEAVKIFIFNLKELAWFTQAYQKAHGAAAVAHSDEEALAMHLDPGDVVDTGAILHHLKKVRQLLGLGRDWIKDGWFDGDEEAMVRFLEQVALDYEGMPQLLIEPMEALRHANSGTELLQKLALAAPHLPAYKVWRLTAEAYGDWLFHHKHSTADYSAEEREAQLRKALTIVGPVSIWGLGSKELIPKEREKLLETAVQQAMSAWSSTPLPPEPKPSIAAEETVQQAIAGILIERTFSSQKEVPDGAFKCAELLAGEMAHALQERFPAVPLTSSIVSRLMQDSHLLPGSQVGQQYTSWKDRMVYNQGLVQSALRSMIINITPRLPSPAKSGKHALSTSA